MDSPMTTGAARRTGRLGTSAAVAGLFATMCGGALATLLHQARTTASTIEDAALRAGLWQVTEPAADDPADLRTGPLPNGDGLYAPDGRRLSTASRLTGSGSGSVLTGPGSGSVLTVAMLGDSTAVGFGCRTPGELPGVQLVRAVAGALLQPVRLVTGGLVGCGAADLTRQVGFADAQGAQVAVIVIGANDIRDKVPPRQSAALLGAAVRSLHGRGIAVVVGTCPDFGVIAPIPQPLRTLLGTWSRRLADLQARQVRAAGGRVVPIGKVVSPEFAGRPELFSPDGFHPSGAGYARAVARLAGPVIDELETRVMAPPSAGSGADRVVDLTTVDMGGTDVDGTGVDGAAAGTDQLKPSA